MAQRYVEIKFSNTNRAYAYRVPDSISDKLSVGQEVKLPGNLYNPNPSWRPISKILDNYKEQKNIHYVDILEVRKPAPKVSRAAKAEKNAMRSMERAAMSEFLAQEARKRTRYKLARECIDNSPIGTPWLDDMM